MDGLWDVIVVGGGVMGSAVTYHLSLRGYNVLMLEQVRTYTHAHARTRMHTRMNAHQLSLQGYNVLTHTHSHTRTRLNPCKLTREQIENHTRTHLAHNTHTGTQHTHIHTRTHSNT